MDNLTKLYYSNIMSVTLKNKLSRNALDKRLKYFVLHSPLPIHFSTHSLTKHEKSLFPPCIHYTVLSIRSETRKIAGELRRLDTNGKQILVQMQIRGPRVSMKMCV